MTLGLAQLLLTTKPQDSLLHHADERITVKGAQLVSVDVDPRDFDLFKRAFGVKSFMASDEQSSPVPINTKV